MMTMLDPCPNATTESSQTYGYLVFAFLINGPATTAIIVFGCLGNIYSIFLLTRRLNIRKTVIMYLCTLAIWDTILLVCSLVYYSVGAFVEWFQWDVQVFVDTVTIQLHPFSSISMTASVWMLLVITSERHLAIWKPLKHRVIDRSRRARLICIFISLLSVLYNIPTFLELEFASCFSEDKQTVERYVDGTLLRKTSSYILVYRVLMSLIFTSLVPFILVLVLTILMIKLVKQASVTRNQMLSQGLLDKSQNRDKKERNTTLMLLALALKFLVCHCLPTVLNVWESIVQDPNVFPQIFLYFVEISNLLVVLNSATNCIIYFRCRNKLKRRTKKVLVRQLSDTCGNGSTANYQTVTKLDSYPGTGASRSCSPSLSFQASEAKILREIWKENLEKADPSIGTRVLVALIRKKPTLSIQFGIKENQMAELERCPQLVNQGEVISSFFGQVIHAANDLAAENRAADFIRDVGLKHFERGINFNNEMWKEFRAESMDFLFSVIQTMDLGHLERNHGISLTVDAAQYTPHPGATESSVVRVWTRLVCFIIREMKQGFLNAALKSNDYKC